MRPYTSCNVCPSVVIFTAVSAALRNGRRAVLVDEERSSAIVAFCWATTDSWEAFRAAVAAETASSC